MHSVGPGVFLVESETVFAPAGEHLSTKAVVKIFGFSHLAQNVYKAVYSLKPGTYKLSIVHAAMLCLCRLFVGHGKPKG
jgi:hypothetical protein